MSAMPDLRLQATPEVKSKAKQPAKAPEPSRNEASSFATLYAKERHAHTGEPENRARKAAEEPSEPSVGQPTEDADAAAVPPTLAADGNSLPSDGEAPVEALDPLLAMALSAVHNPIDDVAPLDEGASAVMRLVGTQADPAVEQDVLDPLAMLQPVADEEIKVSPGQEAVSKSARIATSTDFAAAMAALGKGDSQSKAGEPASLELALDDFAKDALESLKDSAQPNRPDQFVSKLNALTQALNQQATAAPRLPQVAGQPLAMQQGGWSEALVDRVMWLSSQNLKSAEIQLDPAELGRLEVRVNMSQDQAQVTFASPNAAVRDALEGQMQRLRELFAQQGMNLADASVSDQSLGRGWQGQGEGGGGRGDGGNDRLAVEEALPSGQQELRSERLTAGLGLVDYYA